MAGAVIAFRSQEQPDDIYMQDVDDSSRLSPPALPAAANQRSFAEHSDLYFNTWRRVQTNTAPNPGPARVPDTRPTSRPWSPLFPSRPPTTAASCTSTYAADAAGAPTPTGTAGAAAHRNAADSGVVTLDLHAGNLLVAIAKMPKADLS
jgi:hypothetical protein